MKKIVLICDSPEIADTFLEDDVELYLLCSSRTLTHKTIPSLGSIQEVIDLRPDLVIFLSSGYGMMAKTLRDSGVKVFNGGVFNDSINFDETTRKNVSPAGLLRFIPNRSADRLDDCINDLLSVKHTEMGRWLVGGRVLTKDEAVEELPFVFFNQPVIEKKEVSRFPGVQILDLGGAVYLPDAIPGEEYEVLNATAFFSGQEFLPQVYFSRFVFGAAPLAASMTATAEGVIKDLFQGMEKYLSPLKYSGVITLKCIARFMEGLAPQISPFAITSSVPEIFWANLKQSFSDSQSLVKFCISCSKGAKFSPEMENGSLVFVSQVQGCFPEYFSAFEGISSSEYAGGGSGVIPLRVITYPDSHLPPSPTSSAPENGVPGYRKLLLHQAPFQIPLTFSMLFPEELCAAVVLAKNEEETKPWLQPKATTPADPQTQFDLMPVKNSDTSFHPSLLPQPLQAPSNIKELLQLEVG